MYPVIFVVCTQEIYPFVGRRRQKNLRFCRKNVFFLEKNEKNGLGFLARKKRNPKNVFLRKRNGVSGNTKKRNGNETVLLGREKKRNEKTFSKRRRLCLKRF